jgi:hypothetical protein
LIVHPNPEKRKESSPGQKRGPQNFPARRFKKSYASDDPDIH